jgi:hypothetical protein
MERWGEGDKQEDRKEVYPHGYRFINLMKKIIQIDTYKIFNRCNKSNGWVLELDKDSEKSVIVNRYKLGKGKNKLLPKIYICIDRFGDLHLYSKPPKYCMVIGRVGCIVDNFIGIDGLDNYWKDQWKGLRVVRDIYE